MILPLIVLNGMNAVSIRLPLIYLAGKKILNPKYGLVAMFFMAISPWRVVNARWAVESNIMPFIFLAGFICCMQNASPSSKQSSV